MFYIYLIKNLVNNKIYIGQTKNKNSRWSQHKFSAKNNKSNMLITRAISKYGASSFSFEIIACSYSLDDINYLEQIIITQYNSTNPDIGYNLKPGGNNIERTDVEKQLISKGLKNYYKNNRGPRYGVKLSEETKRKQSVAMIGSKGTNLGKKFSDQWKKNISKSLIGRKFSEESLKKLSESHIGKSAPNRKLTKDQAGEIRELYRSGDYSQKTLGQMFNITQATVYSILHNKTYKEESLSIIPADNNSKIGFLKKFTDNDVLEIRRLYNNGEHTYKSLADIFNTKCWVIKSIVRGITYKYVNCLNDGEQNGQCT